MIFPALKRSEEFIPAAVFKLNAGAVEEAGSSLKKR
jgi:hypothetical protein